MSTYLGGRYNIKVAQDMKAYCRRHSMVRAAVTGPVRYHAATRLTNLTAPSSLARFASLQRWSRRIPPSVTSRSLRSDGAEEPLSLFLAVHLTDATVSHSGDGGERRAPGSMGTGPAAVHLLGRSGCSCAGLRTRRGTYASSGSAEHVQLSRLAGVFRAAGKF